MKFENAFAVAAPIDEVYAALLDVERVAPCVPGAQVLERTAEDAYNVGIKVKVGPMSMTYRGSVEIIDRDAEAHRAVMSAKAKETRGQGTADARVQMELMPDDGATLGTINADVQLSGKAAAMGQGIINDVSARIVETFSQNLAAMLAERPGEVAEAPPAAEPAAGEPEAGGEAPSPRPLAPPTPTPVGRPESDALPIGKMVGPVLLARLRDPRVLSGLGALLVALLLLRRRR
jgi:carbon monoxide dehydrogenase subunit G